MQIQSLDKNKTVLLIPGGIMEEHGPYLPAFSDGYWNEKLTDTIANSLAAQDWNVIIFPTIPLGNSGANDIASKYSFPGTYTVRFETLRSVFMDLATELGEQGFKNIFIIHSHGAPNHQRALDQAAAFFNETYHGKMTNLMGINALQLSWFDAANAKDQEKVDGIKMHGGMSETSSMLYIVPHLVDTNYKQAIPYAGEDMQALIQIAKSPHWQGYFGSEKIASATYGEEAWKLNAKDCLKYVFDILNNKINIDTVFRFGDFMQQSKPDVALDKLSLQEEQKRKNMQIKWLLSKKIK
ncbi:MAG TPA: creatininase family protein [Chitinophagaceae bacterium]|nr:creatininase family protein [Chitinophagaceae bacterium]